MWFKCQMFCPTAGQCFGSKTVISILFYEKVCSLLYMSGFYKKYIRGRKHNVAKQATGEARRKVNNCSFFSSPGI